MLLVNVFVCQLQVKNQIDFYFIFYNYQHPFEHRSQPQTFHSPVSIFNAAELLKCCNGRQLREWLESELHPVILKLKPSQKVQQGFFCIPSENVAAKIQINSFNLKLEGMLRTIFNASLQQGFSQVLMVLK